MSMISIVGLLVLAVFALLVIRVGQAIARVGGISTPVTPPEDIQILNDLARGLDRMEHRIEAVETILENAPAPRQETADRRGE